jgi:hypothetical protein
MSFQAYLLAQQETKTAYELYNYASAALENAKIKERLAEIKSQHEPLASLIDKPLSERDRLLHAAFYVVVGRFPDHNLNADKQPVV